MLEAGGCNRVFLTGSDAFSDVMRQDEEELG